MGLHSRQWTSSIYRRDAPLASIRRFPFNFRSFYQNNCKYYFSAIQNFSQAEIDIKISHSNASRAACTGSANKMANVYIWRVGWTLKIPCPPWLPGTCMGHWKSAGLIILQAICNILKTAMLNMSRDVFLQLILSKKASRQMGSKSCHWFNAICNCWAIEFLLYNYDKSAIRWLELSFLS